MSGGMKRGPLVEDEGVEHLFTDYFFLIASCSACSLAVFSLMPTSLALRMLLNTLVFFSSSDLASLNGQARGKKVIGCKHNPNRNGSS